MESQANSGFPNPSDLEMEKKRFKTLLNIGAREELRKSIDQSADNTLTSARKKKNEDDTTHKKKPADKF